MGRIASFSYCRRRFNAPQESLTASCSAGQGILECMSEGRIFIRRFETKIQYCCVHSRYLCLMIFSKRRVLALVAGVNIRSFHKPCSSRLPPFISRFAYNICFPLVSIGKNIIATNAARIKPPETNTGALGLAFGMLAAMIGAHSPAILFKKLEMPVPVPRFGAGNTSGVYAYKTPIDIQY